MATRSAALSLIFLGLLASSSLLAGQETTAAHAVEAKTNCQAELGAAKGGECGACGWGPCDVSGGGMCGLAQECATDVEYTPTFNFSRECGEQLLSTTLPTAGRGISVGSACLRPELTLTDGNATVIIKTWGCPDHKFFRDVRRANSLTCAQGYGTSEDPRSGVPEVMANTARREATMEGMWKVDSNVKHAFNSGYDLKCTKDGRQYACKLAMAAAQCSALCDYAGAEPIECKETCDSQAEESEMSKSSIGMYTPVKRDLTFMIPKTPTRRAGEASVTPPAELGGVIGVAVNGVIIVGPHVDSATETTGDMTMAFDSCGGHGDLDHRYHYHIPPYCLLRSLNGTVPARSDWWLAFHPETQWPAKGESPLIGWALDGFPIFGPYDPESKMLQVSKTSGCPSPELDDCNGKMLTSGQYAYFLTPTFPFVPTCFRGTTLGSVVAVTVDMKNAEACPAGGYSPEQEKATKDCHAIPQYLFHQIVQTKDWLAATATVGSCFGAILFFQLLIIVSGVQGFQPEVPKSDLERMLEDDADAKLKKAWWSLTFSVLGITITRMLFLLVDPYTMRGIYPALVESLLYGILYPLVNMCTVEMLYLLNSIRSYIYIACIVMVWCQLIIQCVMDGVRSYGKQPSWHFICQAIYCAWGLVVVGAAMFYTILNKKFLWFAAAFFSEVLVVCSIVMLSVSLGGPTDHKYFAWTTWLRVLEFVVVLLYTVVAYDYLLHGSGLPDSQARLVVKNEEHAQEEAAKGDVEQGEGEGVTWSKSFAPARTESINTFAAHPTPVPDGYNETFGAI